MKRTMTTLLIACGLAIGCASVAMAGASPTISTGSATKIADSSATLNGSVNPQGTKTAYRFEYGLNTQYGLESKVESAGSGNKAVSVSVGISHLLPGTTYHYKLIALSKDGAAQASDRSFKTTGHAPPVVGTGGPIAIHQTSATVTGTVNPNNATTTYEFQYGTTTSYTQQTIAQTLPASKTTSIVSETLTGLTPGTTFHYRLVALHGTSVSSAGADETFFTLPDPAPTPTVKATTTPKKKTHRPFVITTNGSVSHPSSIPTANACFGDASIKYTVNGRQVASTLAPVLGNCTFSASTTFKKLPAKLKRHKKTETLKVVIRFRGNGYIGPSAAKTDTVTLG
jgi:hypothetical protein